MIKRRDLFNINASREFDSHKDEIVERINEFQDELLKEFGYYLDFKDIYLRNPYEMIISIE